MDNASEENAGKETIYAAGALCWRIYKSELQVLVIHRPRYKDWSWPKGKMRPRETIGETATREVREEVGLNINLGRRLPTLNYETGLGPKEVHYWASHMPQGTQQVHVNDEEVDKAKWVSAAKAHKVLSRASDQIPLNALTAMHEKGTLETRCFVLMRHALAKPRSEWAESDADRPLSSLGRRQAAAISRLLETWLPDTVVSSPWLRCVSTILPYLRNSTAEFETAETLTETSCQQNPAAAQKTIERFLNVKTSVALCVHRPTIPTIFEVISAYLPPELKDSLPAAEPYLNPAEVLVFQLAVEKNTAEGKNKILSIEQYEPFAG